MEKNYYGYNYYYYDVLIRNIVPVETSASNVIGGYGVGGCEFDGGLLMTS